ncbi:MAG: hypothetical protein PUF92_05010 [Subdoligranulum variabile]|nr:hypothetical protein [Subdoligranulum variabile]MDD6424818.1 hypothetical protein [Subdoligranulum variabile]
MQNYLEQAFGKGDCSSVRMRAAVREWMDLYYGTPRSGEDDSSRLAALIVSKLCRTVFAEYELHGRTQSAWQGRMYLNALNDVAKTAMQYALIGGECLLKVMRDRIVPIRRDCYLPLGRDSMGNLTSVGMMQTFFADGKKYVLLERRSDLGESTKIENRLFEVSGQALGRRVPLDTLPACANLSDECILRGVTGLGLGVLRMPTVNCVDGSADPVSIYAPAVGLMHALARCEDQLNHEFLNGASRVFASEDLLRPDASGQRGLRDDLFVGLPDDPANVGVTVYSPTLREGSYLARKQDILRSCESLLGLRRGILSETQAEAQPRTATEIAATSVDYDLTIRSLQRAWQDCVDSTLLVCADLDSSLYGESWMPDPVQIDWGDGVLYDRARVWAEQREMVTDGLLRPEIALAWYYNLPAETEDDLRTVREKYMPTAKGGENNE